MADAAEIQSLKDQVQDLTEKLDVVKSINWLFNQHLIVINNVSFCFINSKAKRKST